MSNPCHLSTHGPLWMPVVRDHEHVARGEWVMVDGELAEIVAWNELPLFFVRMNKDKTKLKEVELWRIQKIKKSQ